MSLTDEVEEFLNDDGIWCKYNDDLKLFSSFKPQLRTRRLSQEEIRYNNLLIKYRLLEKKYKKQLKNISTEMDILAPIIIEYKQSLNKSE